MCAPKGVCAQAHAKVAVMCVCIAGASALPLMSPPSMMLAEQTADCALPLAAHVLQVQAHRVSCFHANRCHVLPLWYACAAGASALPVMSLPIINMMLADSPLPLSCVCVAGASRIASHISMSAHTLSCCCVTYALQVQADCQSRLHAG